MWKERIQENLVGDSYIFLFVFLNAAILAVIYYCCVAEKKEKRRSKTDKETFELSQNIGWARSMRKCLNISYSLYSGITSVFPLLGMFGTVKSLLDLPSLTSGDITAVQGSFFTALTSTAWGIIWAVVFKIFGSAIAPGIEDRRSELDKEIQGGLAAKQTETQESEAENEN
ncbi:MotA/TolQ/ExbB proton channel family protein [Ruminococcus sp. YE71]|uniref:MotA/TolQ/ExbB proton channel family protein n=1 Tax=unclassified Ruminococcus TaxID=2608920 RepID=UPI00088AB493|nr:MULTISPECIES: MotA/TolQ/ExbB proton channel family protein [unclassified Ruminococcus]SDA16871.1 MotA/TolQ/ExbB proton channel family protein [Ruminococcus sp. YE78]SFW25744.1 MotA/TolQ/ExbB proton channel family protein [Ruminococcus sp. YE71]